MKPNGSENPEVAEVGLAFARALAERRFDDAHEMLAPSLRDDLQPRDLRENYELMTGYWSAPAQRVTDVYVEPAWSEWPGKEQNDLGWAYVSLESPTPEGGVNLEAVHVRVARVSNRKVVAQIEWGRP